MHFFEILACDSSIYIMDHPGLLHQTLWEIPLITRLMTTVDSFLIQILNAKHLEADLFVGDR